MRSRSRVAKRQLSVPDRHQLKVARDTLKLRDGVVGFLGGPTKEQARQIIFDLTGKWPPN